MKYYQSKAEGSWVELLPINKDIKKESVVSEADAAKLTAFYDSKKPVLEEEDIYELIDVNIFELKGDYKGIINCRINNKHIQVRF